MDLLSFQAGLVPICRQRFWMGMLDLRGFVIAPPAFEGFHFQTHGLGSSVARFSLPSHAALLQAIQGPPVQCATLGAVDGWVGFTRKTIEEVFAAA